MKTTLLKSYPTRRINEFIKLALRKLSQYHKEYRATSEKDISFKIKYERSTILWIFVVYGLRIIKKKKKEKVSVILQENSISDVQAYNYRFSRVIVILECHSIIIINDLTTLHLHGESSIHQGIAASPRCNFARSVDAYSVPITVSLWQRNLCSRDCIASFPWQTVIFP